MRKRLTSYLLCLMFIAVSLAVLVPTPSGAEPGTIEYQIGTKALEPDGTVWEEFWSDWASDGDEAEVTYVDMTWPGIIAIKAIAPGYHIEYQIGTKGLHSDGSIWVEYWSDWASDGEEAEVLYVDWSWPGIIAIKIKAPDYYVEYQVGTKCIDSDGSIWEEYWSDLASDGNAAEVTYESMTWPGIYCMKAILSVPEATSIDIGPDTLNLKSKGNWITSDINPPEYYEADDIDIDSVMLNDAIPAEWGDVQNDTLMVKFDRADVEDMLSPGTYNLKVTGELTDGTSFEGYSDEVRVIDPL